MQTKTLSILAIAIAFTFGGHLIQAQELSKSGKPLTAQQLRMKNCNADARTQDLHGDARKAFMKSCLSSDKAAAAPAADSATANPIVASAGTPAEPKPLTARQLQRKACGEEAKAEGLKGDPRKEYVKECMKRPAADDAG